MNETFKITSTGRHRHRPGERYGARKGRVYLHGDSVDLVGTQEEVQAAWMHRRTLKHGPALTIALRNWLRGEFDDPNLKLRWSRYAGCSMCPCSPGWIVDSPKLLNQHVGVERAAPPRDMLVHEQSAEARITTHRQPEAIQ